MRVPTYESQTELTGKISAQPFSVRADPGAASQTARAFSALGGVVEQQGQDFYQRLLSEQRDTDLKNAQIDYEQELGNMKLASLNASPSVIMGKGPKGFEAQAAALQDTIINGGTRNGKKYTGISDSVVQKRFKLAASDAASNALITVNQQARNRQIDAAAATQLRYAEHLERQATTGNGPDRQKARDELFGIINKETGKPGLSLFAKMAARGLISKQSAVQLEAKSRSTIARYDVEEKLILADDAQSTTYTARLLAGLKDNKQYPGLDPLTRLAYRQQTVNLQQAIEAKQISDRESAERRSITQGNEDRKENQRKLLAEIFENKNALQRAVTAKGPIPQAISPTRISDDLKRGKISLEFAKYADNLLSNLDAPEDVVGVVTDFTDRITTATTDKQLDDVRKSILESTGRTGTVTLNTAESLLRLINGQENNTQEALDFKEYRRLLSQIVAKTDSSGFLNLGDLDGESAARALDAQQTYFKLTTATFDSKGVAITPMSPEQAFNQIKKQFEQAQEYALPFLFSNLQVGRYFGYSNKETRKAFFKRLTPEKFEEVRTLIKNNDAVAQIEKPFELETVNLLQSEHRAFLAKEAEKAKSETD